MRESTLFKFIKAIILMLVFTSIGGVFFIRIVRYFYEIDVTLLGEDSILRYIYKLFYGYSIIVGFLLLMKKKPKFGITLRLVYWLPLFLGGVSLAVVVYFLSGSLGLISINFDMLKYINIRVIPVLVITIILHATYEEIFFRKLLVSYFGKYDVKSIYLAALIFTLSHMFQPGADISYGVMIYSGAIMYSYIYMSTSSIIAPILVHSGYNLIVRLMSSTTLYSMDFFTVQSDGLKESSSNSYFIVFAIIFLTISFYLSRKVVI